MDQSISLLGRRDTALLLDCRSGAYEHVPLRLLESERLGADEAAGVEPTATEGDYAVVVIDTRVRHELAEGEYAIRQAQCREAVEFFRAIDPGVRSLRDVAAAMARGHMAAMPQPTGRRALHVTTENQRVMEAVEALERDDVVALGPLMSESHRSLRDDYEVSCEELDRVVEICEETEGVIGARMTGGGFGGCAVAIVRTDAIDELKRRIAIGYTAPNGEAANVLRTRPGDGASVENSA
jgi:galactokinase